MRIQSVTQLVCERALPANTRQTIWIGLVYWTTLTIIMELLYISVYTGHKNTNKTQFCTVAYTRQFSLQTNTILLRRNNALIRRYNALI